MINTRGPWEAYFSAHGDPSVVTDVNRPAFTKVCDVSTASPDYGFADCKLIAAAPEMLEALRDAVRLIRHLGGDPGCQERAIAKAKGCHQSFDCNGGQHADCCPASEAAFASSVQDIREYERTKISPEMTVETLSAIVKGIAARQEAELVEGLRKVVELPNKQNPAFSKVESDIRQLYADFQQGVASGRKEEWVAWEFAKDVVRVLSQPENRSPVPAPAINAAARERWFREALNRLLEEHGAAIEVISDGGHLATSLIQVTMNGEWDGEHNQVRQFAQFVL